MKIDDLLGAPPIFGVLMCFNGDLMGFNGDLMGFNGIYDGVASGKQTKSY